MAELNGWHVDELTSISWEANRLPDDHSEYVRADFDAGAGTVTITVGELDASPDIERRMVVPLGVIASLARWLAAVERYGDGSSQRVVILRAGRG